MPSESRPRRRAAASAATPPGPCPVRVRRLPACGTRAPASRAGGLRTRRDPPPPAEPTSGWLRPGYGEGMALFEIDIRHRQEAEKHQGVDDEQHAEAGIPPTEVGNAGRHERDGEPRVSELLHLERHGRYQEGQDAQDLGHRELDLEIRG